MFAHSLLSLLIWLPIVGSVAIMLLAGDKNPSLARVLALFFALASLALCVPLYLQFDTSTAVMQFTEDHAWIPAFNLRYTLGVDGISMPLIMLTAFTTLLVVLGSWHTVRKNVAQYMATFLIMQGMVVGIFSALDTILFYVFWEGILIPMYLCIGIWGSDNRSYASIKFFLYTFFGSALMLAVFLYLGTKAHSFAILDLYPLRLTMTEQVIIFLVFLLGFAVKVPMWPVHTWLPDAHTEAPAGGSVILAAILLKLGAYGFLRFSLPITPDACRELANVMIALSLVAVIYIGFVAIVQKDMKKLIAYSSIAHMGFITLGCFMIYAIVKAAHGDISHAYISVEGAMMQMISHAFSSGAMFLGVGVLYDRLHTRLIKDYGGIANSMPVFAAFFLLFCMANTGLPGTSGFVGEFMVIISAFQASPWISLAAATTVILSAVYTLWMYKRVYYGKAVNPNVAAQTDIKFLDKLVFSLLALFTLGLGVYPAPLLNLFHSTVGHLLTLSLQTKL